MAYKEVSRVDIAEVIRCWQRGNSQRHIAAGTGLSRATVRKYLAAAQKVGVDRYGSAPSEEQLSLLASVNRGGPRSAHTPTEDLLAPWGDQIYQWLSVDRLQMTRIQELLAERGCCVSYNSLRRFILRRNWLRRNPRTVRMGKSPPGEVAEMDFGRLGYIRDPESGRRRTVWALTVVLAYFRHSFLWPIHSQRLREVVAGLEGAWGFFGGIPKYLVVDNFPAAVAGADTLHPSPHPWLPGVLPAPGLHHRSGTGALSQRQAPRGEGHPVRKGALLQGRGVQGPGPPQGRGGPVVPGRGRTADPWHHPEETRGGVRGRRA